MGQAILIGHRTPTCPFKGVYSRIGAGSLALQTAFTNIYHDFHQNTNVDHSNNFGQKLQGVSRISAGSLSLQTAAPSPLPLPGSCGSQVKVWNINFWVLCASCFFATMAPVAVRWKFGILIFWVDHAYTGTIWGGNWRFQMRRRRRKQGRWKDRIEHIFWIQIFFRFIYLNQF